MATLFHDNNHKYTYGMKGMLADVFRYQAK